MGRRTAIGPGNKVVGDSVDCLRANHPKDAGHINDALNRIRPKLGLAIQCKLHGWRKCCHRQSGKVGRNILINRGGQTQQCIRHIEISSIENIRRWFARRGNYKAAALRAAGREWYEPMKMCLVDKIDLPRIAKRVALRVTGGARVINRITRVVLGVARGCCDCKCCCWRRSRRNGQHGIARSHTAVSIGDNAMKQRVVVAGIGAYCGSITVTRRGRARDVAENTVRRGLFLPLILQRLGAKHRDAEGRRIADRDELIWRLCADLRRENAVIGDFID